MKTARKPAEFISEFKALDKTEGFETHTLMLMEPFTVYSGYLDAVITVPDGFTFDGESIPLCLQWLAPPFGDSKRGACVHDWLYRNAGYIDERGFFRPVQRKQADAVYRELIEAKGLPRWRANIRWAALRVVGGFAWRENLQTEDKSLPPSQTS